MSTSENRFMARINSRAKGASGEREFCRWLYDNLEVPMPTRNLEQVRSGGSDIIDIEPFYFEVKRVEKLSLDKWWRQVNKAARNANDDSIIPIVCFRQNRKDWEFLIGANHIGIEKGYLRLTEIVFLRWIKSLDIV